MLRNHKHADDLSFTWYARGREILVDPGVFSYGIVDFREYFISSSAHNTVVVDGQSYDFGRGKLDKVGIMSTRDSGDHFLVMAKNDLYPGVAITRTFIFMKDTESLVIIDDIESAQRHSYSQHYHLSHRFDSTSIDETVERTRPDCCGLRRGVPRRDQATRSYGVTYIPR